MKAIGTHKVLELPEADFFFFFLGWHISITDRNFTCIIIWFLKIHFLCQSEDELDLSVHVNKKGSVLFFSLSF